MLTVLPLSGRLQDHRFRFCILGLCTLLGAAAGAFFAAALDPLYSSMMRSALAGTVSIVGSAVAFLPFLFSFWLVVHSKLWLAYPICTGAVFCFTAVQRGIFAGFGSAGWLISLLQQFSSGICTVSLLYVALTRLRKPGSRISLFWPMVLCIASGMLQHAIFSPFLAELLNTYKTMGRYAIHVGLDRCI